LTEDGRAKIRNIKTSRSVYARIDRFHGRPGGYSLLG
jgi:hypothetical protein